MAKFYAFILISAIAAIAYGRTLHVPEEYATIQAGINASQNGDTVLVGPGEYPEALTVHGQQILLTSSNGPYETTIVGHLVIRDFTDTLGCIFQGFTLYDPNSNPWNGAIGVVLVSGKSRIIGNIIRHHYTTSSGGGIRSDYSAVIISHNIIEDNYAMGYGGGIGYGNVPDAEVSYNIIRNNRTGYGIDGVGGAAGMSVGVGRVFYNLIYGNNTRCVAYPGPSCGDGGGISATGNVEIYNNTIINNTAIRNNNEGDGGGIIISRIYGDTARIVNNIIASNNRGGLIIYYGPPESTYTNAESYNLLYANTVYDLSAPETSQTDIFADPMFTDTASNDYSLQPGSPCIDAGDPSFPLDADSTRVDIGALFFDQSVSIDDSLNIPQIDFELRQNYPNPFNGQTTISYILPSPSKVSLIIFEITGRLVKTLAKHEYQGPGEHLYIWDGTDGSGKSISTAIYFYQLQINEKKIVKSMILIK